MALTDDLPIPPELAVDTEPLSDDDLALYFDVRDTRPGDGSDGPPEEELATAEGVHRWRIEADDQAEWALRKLAVANEELRRLAEQAQEWQARIGAWFSQASARPQRTAAFMEERLADYGLRLREVGGPATLTLPSGVIKTSDRKPAVEVEDDAQLARYLDEMLLPDSEQPEWLAAWSKATEGMEEPLEVVKRTPKVFVGPLRKLVHVEERPTGQTRWLLTLSCDHELTKVTNPEEAAPQLGHDLACALCPGDVIEGETVVKIVALESVELTELLPIGPDGEPVPGASVRPGGIVPKVEAR